MPAIFVLFAIFLGAIAFSDRAARAARWGSGAFALAAAGMVADATRPAGDVLIGFMALAAHFIVLAMVMHAFCIRRGESLPRIALATAIIGSVIFLPPFGIPQGIRLVGVQVLALVIVASVLLRAREWKEPGAVGASIGVMLWLVSASYLARAILFALAPGIDQPAPFFGSLYNIVFHAAGALTGILAALTLLFALGSDAVRREAQMSERDPLTGLGNRRLLERVIAAENDGRWECGGAIAIDLDRFKSVNDRFGHAGGDEVLRRVGAALTSHFNDRALCRVGGEEFLLLVPRQHVGEIEALSCGAHERIRALTFDGPLTDCHVTASVGYAVRKPGQPVGALLREADRAVYAGKEDGRDTVRGAAMVTA